jgi:hypothetical protein
LGNIITAYGGNLTYTVRYVSQPSGQGSRSNSPDVVIVSNNEITLHHYRQDSVPPFGTQTFIIPMYEEKWQHYEEGGVSATRQHLLMALANVKSIYIKATYTTRAEEAALSYVSLATAKEDRFDPSKVRAVEVEECRCPEGHQGLSCEDCVPGYYKGDQGLYLGLCEKCECNGHSDDCDPRTGVCNDCRDNTYGDNCELCLPGFEGDAVTGSCQTPGDSQTLCSNSQCDNRGTASCDDRSGGCYCKPNAVGALCNQCREGTFGLNADNPYGCNECYCSGVTRNCAQGSYYREEIPLFILNEADNFALTDRSGANALPSDFETNVEENEISYRFNDDSYIYYWNLPSSFTGNLIRSYGGKLTYSLRTDGNGQYVPDTDIVIKGNGIELAHSRSDLTQETYSVRFVESEWNLISRTGARPASRADLMNVLSNVEYILIRASIRAYTSESGISDIILETAVSQPTANGRVNDIEVCRCPPGYEGTSCEKCAPNYYRDPSDRTCKICPCENADSCEMKNRRVTCNCRFGWTGEFCRDRVGKRN